MTGANDRASVWCIVQSDGDRSHLSPLNHLDVRRVPIQYCCIGERITLLQQTMQRALRITAPPRVVVTLAAGHRAYWAGPLWSVPAHRRVIDESTGRHTISLAVASTLIEKADSQALAVLMPADAFCANDWALHSGIQAALQALERLPRHLLALALEPPQHGEPQDYLVRGDFDGFPGRAVARCVRRPSTPIGRRLAAAGACINSGVYITRIKTLTEMLENHWPAMLDGVRRILKASTNDIIIPARFDGAEFQRPWRHTWLQRPVTHLRALPVPNTGWSSLTSVAALERLLIDCPEFARLPQGRSPELPSRYAELAQSHSYHRLIPRGDGETLCP